MQDILIEEGKCIDSYVLPTFIGWAEYYNRPIKNIVNLYLYFDASITQILKYLILTNHL